MFEKLCIGLGENVENKLLAKLLVSTNVDLYTHVFICPKLECTIVAGGDNVFSIYTNASVTGH
jgi:hypothetical protein